MEDTMQRQGSLPPHLQQQGYIRAATATPPPMSNGLPYHQRQHTPQPQMISRPGSSHGIRRGSNNLGPGPSHLQQVSQAPNANGYTYMRTPPVHNFAAAQGMPAAPHHVQHNTAPQQYYNQMQHPAQHAFMHEQRRQSVPPAFPQQINRQPDGPSNVPSPPQAEEQRTQDDQSNRLQQPRATKSRSIFTPIDDSRSLLAQHWGTGKTNSESRTEVKRESESQTSRSGMVDNQSQQPSKMSSPPTRPQQQTPVPRRTNSSEFVPPMRTDSAAGAKRPKLKVHIPEEQSETESTEESSKNQSGSKNETPAKTNTENSHSSGTGVVLPPPSPSASAILSAGASGPPNPFARPLPPSGAQQHNNAAFERNRNEDTPISALPSRFVADGLLPSPSSFYPEWGFGRSGGESANILPSPLNFQTPVNSNGPNFGREDEAERKRKSPEGEGQEPSLKRVKT